MTEREGIKGERSEGHFLCYCTKYLKLRNELFAQKQSLTSKGFLKLNTVKITDKKTTFRPIFGHFQVGKKGERISIYMCLECKNMLRTIKSF